MMVVRCAMSIAPFTVFGLMAKLISRIAVNVAGDLVASIFVDRRVLGSREQKPADAGIATDASSERGPDL